MDGVIGLTKNVTLLGPSGPLEANVQYRKQNNEFTKALQIHGCVYIIQITCELTNTTMTTTTAPITFQTDAAGAAITTEQLALIGFAAALSTCVNNDDTGSKKAKSVRDEAKLLMSLLMGKKASDILSEEIGVNDDDDGEVQAEIKSEDKSTGDFTFTFPALSLQPGSSAGAPDGESSDDAAQKEKAELPPPSELLARPQSVNDKDAVKDCSETMAQNVLESFGAALIWRAKTWVNSLAQVLTLSVNGAEANSDSNKVKGGESDGEQAESNFGEDEITNSREMQIIEAIVRSSEEVSVVNVKTTFRVMPQRIEQGAEPVSKKQKTESDIPTYKVMHKLHFEAIVSMTSNEGGRYKNIKLQAPGSIEGTFVARVNYGDDILRGVSIKLDTDAFALSLERESRAVVRRAAEAALLAASGMEISEVGQVHHSVISPRYVLMSPMQPPHDGSDQETDLTQSTFSTAIREDEGCSDSSAVTTPSLSPSKTPRGSSVLSPSPAPL
jgi:hypothetical protein